MVNITSKWEDELAHWLEPFLDRLGHKARRRMCPLYALIYAARSGRDIQPMIGIAGSTHPSPATT